MASIKKRPNGQWRARYRDEAGIEHARHFDRKVDAQRWLDEVTTSVLTGQYVDPRAGQITFERYAATWAERQVWVPKTGVGHRQAVRCTTFRTMELRKIRLSHVEQWVKLMRDGDPTEQDPHTLAATTIATRFNHVRAVFRAAVRDRLIASDPCENVVLPRTRKREASMTIPTGDQVGALVRAGGERFGAYVALCAFAGLRLGEAAALQVADIDFLRRTLHVRRQVQLVDRTRVDVRAPKYGSEREVHLPAELVTMLSQHVTRLSNGPSGRWLFQRAEGEPFHQNTVTYLWREARKRAAVTGVRLHDLRHFYASGLIAAGCDVVTVSRALGHTSSTTTLATYAHLWPSAEDKTRQAAAGLMADALRPADSLRTEKGG
jgi:integrase